MSAIGVFLTIILIVITGIYTFITYRGVKINEHQFTQQQIPTWNFIVDNEKSCIQIKATDPSFCMDQVNIAYPKNLYPIGAELQEGNVVLLSPPDFKWNIEGLRSFIKNDKILVDKILEEEKRLLKGVKEQISEEYQIELKGKGISIEEKNNSVAGNFSGLDVSIDVSIRSTGELFRIDNNYQFLGFRFPICITIYYTHLGKNRSVTGLYWILYSVSYKNLALKDIVFENDIKILFKSVRLIKYISSLDKIQVELDKLLLETKAGAIIGDRKITIITTATPNL
jgi:hypothetical protein